jgi:hypothetical protein
MGNYIYRISNSHLFDFELRLNSFDGERVAYIPRQTSNWIMYASSTEPIHLFPVLVAIDRFNRVVTTVTTHQVTVIPRRADSGLVQTYTFSIMGLPPAPISLMHVTNNVTGLNCRVVIGNNILIDVNGFNTIYPRQRLTYPIHFGFFDPDAIALDINIHFFNGSIILPVRFAGQSTSPVIKRGFQYSVTITGDVITPDGYTVTLIENGQIPLDDIWY